MKTVVIMYMPGHAGNFIQRLFGLSPTFLPILEKRRLNQLISHWEPVNPSLNKLSYYKFSYVPKLYKNWQDFHRAFADLLDYADYRLLNLISKLQYDFIYSAHPHELETRFMPVDHTEFYNVELDTAFDQWVLAEQKKLHFAWREQEVDTYNSLKLKYNMKPISLTKLLGTEQEFLDEYHRVCELMKIQPVDDSALELCKDWRSVRFTNRT